LINYCVDGPASPVTFTGGQAGCVRAMIVARHDAQSAVGVMRRTPSAGAERSGVLGQFAAAAASSSAVLPGGE
jgi:hypothetical protein